MALASISVMFTSTTWCASTQASQCMLCNKNFTLRLRRHHCRHCGHIFCCKTCLFVAHASDWLLRGRILYRIFFAPSVLFFCVMTWSILVIIDFSFVCSLVCGQLSRHSQIPHHQQSQVACSRLKSDIHACARGSSQTSMHVFSIIVLLSRHRLSLACACACQPLVHSPNDGACGVEFNADVKWLSTLTYRLQGV